LLAQADLSIPKPNQLQKSIKYKNDYDVNDFFFEKLLKKDSLMSNVLD